jgi:hypothetical protein
MCILLSANIHADWVRLPIPLIILFGSCELEYLVNHISADTLTTGQTNNPSADHLGLGLWCLMPLSTIFLQLYMQSVPITTKVGSLNPVHGEVHSIQHYVIKFVSDL